MSGAGGGGEGRPQAATEGVSYGRVNFDNDVNDPAVDQDPEVVIPVGDQTGSIIVQSPDGDTISNNSDIYLGWDDEVDETSGLVLTPGESISIDLNAAAQNLFAIPEDDSDELRFMTTN